MTDDNMIRIDKKEYEFCGWDSLGHLIVQPKRKQIGWACYECPFECKTKMHGLFPPTTFRCANRLIVPVYGPVV